MYLQLNTFVMNFQRSFSISQKFTLLLFLALLPLLVWGQADRSSEPGEAGASAETTEEAPANYNNTRSNRSTVVGPGETNVCDGVTCADGSCAATEDECSAVTPVTESVCNGYLCDDGQCVSDEVWCGIDFDFAVDSPATAIDSVCNGYLCDDGTCMSSEAMCGFDFEEISGSAAACPAGSPVRCGDGSCSDSAERCLAIEKSMELAATPGSMPDYDDPDVAADFPDPGFPENENVADSAQNHNSSRSNRTDGIVAPNDAETGLDEDDVAGEDYNSPRSNRSINNPADDVNLCDGVTCADGSCAPTADACDGDDVAGEDYNTPRSNRSIKAPEDDIVDSDSDGDGIDDATEGAQNYNSSRSNKPSSIFDDSRERPEIMAGPNGFTRLDGSSLTDNVATTSAADAATNAASAQADGRVHCWGRAKDENGKVYAWGQGICVALDASAEQSATATARIAALQVTGDEVRTWSEEERSAWQEYRKKRGTTSPAEQLAEQMIMETQADERIKEIRANAGLSRDAVPSALKAVWLHSDGARGASRTYCCRRNGN